jgi:hypothetical protein
MEEDNIRLKNVTQESKNKNGENITFTVKEYRRIRIQRK